MRGVLSTFASGVGIAGPEGSKKGIVELKWLATRPVT